MEQADLDLASERASESRNGVWWATLINESIKYLTGLIYLELPLINNSAKSCKIETWFAIHLVVYSFDFDFVYTRFFFLENVVDAFCLQALEVGSASARPATRHFYYNSRAHVYKRCTN